MERAAAEMVAVARRDWRGRQLETVLGGEVGGETPTAAFFDNGIRNMCSVN